MKNQQSIFKICFGILSSMVLFLHAYSHPGFPPKNNLIISSAGSPPGSSVTDITICNNQLPYHWNGLTCLAAGTYSATLVGSNGGDSIAVLNLTVINVSTSITNAIVCNNELPYQWNGNSYSSNGTYSVTLTSSSGCDSVPILSLTVNDVVTSTTNRTICSNLLPFNWNGNNYPAAGMYTVTLTSTAGCDSIATLNLTVKPVSASTSSRTVCFNQLPYNWNGNSYPAAGTYTVTLIAANGCDSVATLQLSVTPLTVSNTSVTVCTNELPYAWNGHNYSAAGVFSTTLTGSSGCDSIPVLNLSVIPVTTSLTYVTICDGQLPYSWNGNSYPGTGIYSVTLTGSNGCDSIATLRLTSVPFLTSITEDIICNSELPYTWNSNSYVAAGTYTAAFVNSAGCDSIATLELSVSTPHTATDSVFLCNEQLPFTWHGQVYTAAGDYPIVPPVVIDACTSIDLLVLTVQVITPSTTFITVCNNHLPFVWNGNNYSATGIYGVALSSSTGCDSIANLNLLVASTAASITNITTCTNQLPFTWNGNSYNSSGVHTATLISASGCDSVATLNLTVNPVVSSTSDITICSTQLPFSWNGNSYSGNGTYVVTLTSSGGCDSIATLHLVVQGFLSSTTNITACNNQLPYNWNGNSYPTAGIYSVNLISAAGCDSVATLNLTVNNIFTSTTNINICTSQLPFSWNGNSYSTAGIYTATLITTGGCDSVATLNLVINSTVTSLSDITICNNQLPFSWNGNSYALAGVYLVTLTSSGGCDSLATLNLVVTDILTSTTNVTICPALLPYTWNGNSYPIGGTYSVTLSTPAGCDSVPILSLTIAPYVESTTDITICNSQLPYNWNGNSYAAAGIYSVLLTGTGVCDSLATLNLAIQTTLTSTTSVAICETQLPYTWNGTSYPTAGTFSVTLTSSAGCDSVATLNLTTNPIVSSETNISICANQLPYNWNGDSYSMAGIYTVTLISSAGCDSIATLNLVTNPVVSSTTNIILCDNQLPYNWNGNSYSAAGTYSVVLTSSSGCDSIVTLNLAANPIVTSTTNVSICDNQLPYNWNGNSYAIGGTYFITLTASSGCDSVATLNLVANPVVTSTTNIGICDNQLPYSWNGNSYPAAGTYSISLSSSAGCDSIATLNLVVNPVLTSTTNISICDNQLPYAWNGNSYPTAGTYSVVLTSSSGCDSIVTLNLVANPIVTSTTSISICDSQLPYAWNGNSYPTGGTYSITLTSSSGCDSVTTLILVANPVITSSIQIGICDNQLPYNWNGNNYSTAGMYPVTLTSSAGCDSIATLTLIVHSTAASITGVSTCENQLPYAWNGQQYSTAGTYTVTLVSSAGCDSVATLNLTINPVVTGVANASTCTNQLPYTWNGQNYNNSGIYSVTLTGSNGCDSVSTLHLTVNPVVSSSTDASTCSGQLPFTWNGQGYTTAGPHIVTLTSSSGCDSIATLNLTISPTPPAPAVNSPIIYCQYEATSIVSATATTPGSQLLWYTSASGGTGSQTAPTPSSATAGTTNYYVSQVDGPCEGPRALITVTVNSKPNLGPDQSIKICFNQSANIATLYDTTGYTSSWMVGTQPVADPSVITIAGTYQLLVQNNSGCADTALVNLGIQPPVIANAGTDADAETNVPYQLSGTGGGQYQWSPTGPLNNPFISNPLATLSHDETFVLMVSDDIGCFDLDTVKIRVLNGPTFYVPSAFTPNGDGLNDIFRPTPVGIATLDFFRVFNRFGELVYETSEIGKGWDGTYKGKKQNIGNYVWSLKGPDRLGKLKIMKGNVALLR